ncbi:NfeD family protein [Labilibacter sediminis]|nr:NfeD family protein [Labilibacter sediminis]
MEFLSNHALVWFIAGVILLLLEFAIPGVFILFFGVGAIITSICTYLFEPSLGVQFLIFSLTSVLSLIFLRSVILKKLNRNKVTEDPDEEFVGGIGQCIADISPDSEGKVEFKGTNWNASSKVGISSGAKVKIVNKVGLCLEVEPA